MCISRVGKVISVRGKKATVKLLGDDKLVQDVDVSAVNARVNCHVEVFANIALSVVSSKEARERKQAWLEIMHQRKE